ncbi:uncharacterized protein [Henckelia pumila]|uniref:uncharacterized protein n=1 Tax=Henckelia pumila TaxID=405737 RepID=UPI003C6DF365
MNEKLKYEVAFVVCCLCQIDALSGDESVSSFLHNGSWNSSLVRSLFPTFLAQEILTIPISHSMAEDSRYWQYHPKIKYLVRNGYKLEIGFFDSHSHSSESQSKSWWKHLWAMSLPPKGLLLNHKPKSVAAIAQESISCKNASRIVSCCYFEGRQSLFFLGYAMSAYILVNIRQVFNAMQMSVHLQAEKRQRYGLLQCLCHSTCHALFWFHEAMICWKGTMFLPFLKTVKNLGIIDVFIWMEKMLCRKDLEKFAMRTWAIWKERMRISLGPDHLHANISVEWSGTMLSEFHRARESVLICSKEHTSMPQARWSKPPSNQLHLDVDAALNTHTNNYAVGGVVRDHVGNLILAFGMKIPKPVSVTYGELMALREVLRLIVKRGMDINEVYTDSFLAAQAVARPKEDYSYIGAIATEVKNILQCRSNIKLKHFRRSATSVAHKLASFTISSPSSFVWELGNFPFWLVKLVNDDVSIS